MTFWFFIRSKKGRVENDSKWNSVIYVMAEKKKEKIHLCNERYNINFLFSGEYESLSKVKTCCFHYHLFTFYVYSFNIPINKFIFVYFSIYLFCYFNILPNEELIILRIRPLSMTDYKNIMRLGRTIFIFSSKVLAKNHNLYR